MALVGKTERRDVPGEEGEWMEFRKLTGGELDQAQEVAMKKAIALVQGVDGAAIEAMRSGAAAAAEEGDSYDADTLVEYGVVAWSYTEPCDAENKRRLEAATRDWAAGVIKEMNVRPPVSAAASNGSSPPDESVPNSASPTVSTQAE